MDGIELLKSPWDKALVELASTCAKSVQVMCPFVKADALDMLLSHLSPKVRVRLVTRIALQYFHRRVSDVVALRTLLERHDSVLNAPRLHAKVYLFDGKCAIVTSGNLTMSGLRHNFEYGLLLHDGGLVQQVADDFRALTADTEETGRVTKLALDQIEDILQRMPTYVEPQLRQPLPSETEDDVLAGETETIASALRGWQQVVFLKLNELPQTFSLPQVYQFEDHFRKHYPANRHIPDAIRRELQVLRDRGLIKFLGGGNYQRLWR
jgi:HKD family nuclease